MNTAPASNFLIIDAQTQGVAALLRALRRLKSTLLVEHAGAYRQDPSYCQVHIHTTKTEKELDEWAYSAKVGNAVVGVFASID